jgi:hypothetical protein
MDETPRRELERPNKRRWALNINHLFAALSILGFGGVSFLAGAAVMEYQLPVADFLSAAFRGAKDAVKKPFTDEGQVDGRIAPSLTITSPEKAFNGYTLFVTTEGAEARLYDHTLKEVHLWKMPKDHSWAQAEGVRAPAPDAFIHWEHVHLFPNGDLIAMCAAGADTPYGFGLVKLDRSSRILWGVGLNVHHDFTVGEDGKVYALGYHQTPSAKGEVSKPMMLDSVIILSSEGKVLDRIPLMQAFEGTPFEESAFSRGWEPGMMLGGMPMPPGMGFPPMMGGPPMTGGMPPGMMGPPMAGRPGWPPMMGGPPMAGGPPMTGRSPWPGMQPIPTPDKASAEIDPLHANSIRVLSKALAPKFPRFKEGQLLLSLRTPGLLGIIDVPTRKVTWAARGPWKSQHDAHFLDSGRILLFDNFGGTHGSRVLEFDPETLGVPWSAGSTADRPIRSVFRGRCQRLPNGNTLYVDPAWRVFELTPEKEAVWEMSFPQASRHPSRNITVGKRFRPEDLVFLKGETHAKP